MKIYNTNPEFGMEGPFESDNFESLADEMTSLFEEWSGGDLGKMNELRDKFIAGLVEIK